MFKLSRFVGVVSIGLSSPAVASAVLVEFNGEVAFLGPTFDRPFVAGADLGPSNLGVGYQVKPFDVTETGGYRFDTATLDFDNGVFWNGALLIYEEAFDPLLPEENLIAYEGVGGGTFDSSTVIMTFDSNQQYFLVQCGELSFDFGPYSGTAQPVTSLSGRVRFDIPEPALGLLLPAAVSMRRRGRGS
jgi:hypothetical protein